MELTGLLVLYSGGDYRLLHGTPSPDRVADWPTDGFQVGVMFFDVEWAPGKPYRQYMMSVDTYFLAPGGILGHSSDPPDAVRERYGADTVVWLGKWETLARFRALESVATACDSLDKLSPEWLDTAIAGALP